MESRMHKAATQRGEAEAPAKGNSGLDMIDHPPHYTATLVEPINVIEAWHLSFHLGNCVKYIARCDLKGKPIEDLEKARWYLDREIAKRKGQLDQLT